jgi:hypothetical protein
MELPDQVLEVRALHDHSSLKSNPRKHQAPIAVFFVPTTSAGGRDAGQAA